MASQSSGYPYRCAFCGRHFKTHLLLVDHKINTKFNHYYCRRCQLDLPTAAQLRQHLEAPISIVRHEQDGTIRCTRCNHGYGTMSAFDSHFKEKHSRGCTNCHLDFHSIFALQRHRDASHPSLNSSITEAQKAAESNFGDRPLIPSSPRHEAIPISFTEHPDSRVENGSARASTPAVSSSDPPSQETATVSPPNSSLPNDATPIQQTLSAIDDSILVPDEAHSISGAQVGDVKNNSQPVVMGSNDVQASSRNGPSAEAGPTIFYCRKCNMGFPNHFNLREHLDQFEPVLERFSTPDGGFRCRACHTIFSSVEGFKNHVRRMDRTHEILLANWCIPCLLKFHTQSGLAKHNQTVHGRSSVSSPSIGLSLAANSSVSVEASISRATSAEPPSTGIGTPRPLDVLFSSFLPSSATLVSETSRADQETTATAPASTTAETTRATLPSSIPPTASSSPPPRRTFGTYPWKRYDLFCNRCQVAFSSRQEQLEHLQRGIPAAIPDKTHEGNLVCSQCPESTHDTNTMKAHVGLHAATCTDCLLYFHGPKGLREHRESQHAPSSVGDSFSTTERTEFQSNRPLCTDLQGSSDRKEVILVASGSNASASHISSEPNPSNNSSTSSQPVRGRRMSSMPYQTPPTEGTAQSPVDATDTSATDSTQGPEPNRAPGPLDSSSSSSSTSSPGPPSQLSLPSQPDARPDAQFCRKCRIQFTTSQERTAHVRSGMSTIREAEDGQGSITCAQCNKSFPDIMALKRHLRAHNLTCVDCLLYFHVFWAFRAHRQTLHAENSSNESGQSAGPPPSGHRSAPQAPELTSIAPVVEPEDRSPATSVSTPPRTSSYRESIPRAQRVVRQISLQDFSDTDEDDNPEDLDNSDLGGWDRTDIQPQRPLEPTARPARTAGNVSGRHLQPTGRRTGEGQRWWWGGPPQVASWADLASGRPPQNTGPGIVGAPATSNAIAANPKVPRISSIAVQCIICLEEPAVDLTSTPCGHVGCEACLRQAVQTKPECPHCRKPMRLSELRALYL